jgi:TolB-like protein
MLGGGAFFVMAIFLAAAFTFWSSEKVPESNIFVQNSSEPTILIYPLENLSDKEDSNSLSAAFTDSMIQNLSQYSGVVVLSGAQANMLRKMNIPIWRLKKIMARRS